MLLRAHARLTTLAATTRHRVMGRRRDDTGLTTLEWTVLTLGAFLIAGLAVAGITAAINNRLGLIH